MGLTRGAARGVAVHAPPRCPPPAVTILLMTILSCVRSTKSSQPSFSDTSLPHNRTACHPRRHTSLDNTMPCIPVALRRSSVKDPHERVSRPYIVRDKARRALEAMKTRFARTMPWPHPPQGTFARVLCRDVLLDVLLRFHVVFFARTLRAALHAHHWSTPCRRGQG